MFHFEVMTIISFLACELSFYNGRNLMVIIFVLYFVPYHLYLISEDSAYLDHHDSASFVKSS